MSDSEQSIDLLRRLTDAPGVPGHEDAVRTLFREELDNVPGCTFGTDRAGSILCQPTEGDPEKPRLMLTAHMDEVGFMVRVITPRGFIQFVPLGGWWSHTLLAQEVSVLTRSGESIPGVITSTPPHFLSDADRKQVIPTDKLFVDVGATSREEVEEIFGIRVGDSIVPQSTFRQMKNPKFLMAKAFDNRVGMGLLIETLQATAGTALPNHLVGVATVQEEVGTRGAHTATEVARPDLAIVLEGPPADDTPGFSLAEAQGALGEGVQIRIMDPTAIMNRPLVDYVIDLARRERIPHQLTVRQGGGTDARTIQITGRGVPSIVIGVPSRYIHTHRSIIHTDDYAAALRLVKAIVEGVDRKTADSFFTYLT
ncbi:MAG: M42 family metallopeptidase [Verrucomicrobiota bacterium]